MRVTIYIKLHYVAHENMCNTMYTSMVNFVMCNVQYIMNFHLPCIRSSMNLSASLVIFVNMHTSYKCLQMLLFMLDFPPSSNIFKMMCSLICDLAVGTHNSHVCVMLGLTNLSKLNAIKKGSCNIGAVFSTI